VETLSFLLERDSVHGRFENVEAGYWGFWINNVWVRVTSERNPASIPWGDYGVDVVVEATGLFRDRESAQKHLGDGVKKVIITAPAKNPDATIVLGVNDEIYDREKHDIVSLASCTTNCLAPIAKAIDDRYEIESGFLTTCHAVTNDQVILDVAGKDLRRSRSGMLNMIPTSTGAAAAIGEVIPRLKGKLDGLAIRVPTPDVSIVDLVVKTIGGTSPDTVNDTLLYAAQNMSDILAVSDKPFVSQDFVGDSHSAIVDALSTMVVNGNLVKVLAWYDNEIGYASRVVDFCKTI